MDTPGKRPEEGKLPENIEGYESVERHAYFDANPEFFAAITEKRGEWTTEQRKERRRELSGGEEIFDDVGISFYLVKSGDTISEIRESLSAYPEFAYLATQQGKLDSFNIPSKKLRAGLWIPIPVEKKNRELSDAQFVSYTHRAVGDMIDHDVYGAEVQKILEKVNVRDLVATMFATAKQEAGGKPLGQFALHRWEDHQRAFSFSYYHVLMKGPGLKARRKLNLTEGQLYHPENAVKLMLAYMIEKTAETRDHAEEYFPVPDHLESFARFYNGRSWKKTNPHYVENITEHYDEADQHLSKDGDRWKKEE